MKIGSSETQTNPFSNQFPFFLNSPDPKAEWHQNHESEEASINNYILDIKLSSVYKGIFTLVLAKPSVICVP
jgi:hypothetical protein